LLDNDDLGLKEIRGSFDLRKEMSDLADVVKGTDSSDSEAAEAPAGPAAVNGAAATPDLLKKRENPEPITSPPFDADAT
jgi:sec-independent protein translocase protein TatB